MHFAFQNTHFFSNKARESTNTASHSMQFASYILLNPSLKHQKTSNLPTAVHRVINRLRLDTESWCYRHAHQYLCTYCGDSFSPHHYLLSCPVTSSDEFLEQLTIAEHSLSLEKQALMILKRLLSKPYGTRWVAVMEKHPIRVSCIFPEHGDLPHTTLSIPEGL